MLTDDFEQIASTVNILNNLSLSSDIFDTDTPAFRRKQLQGILPLEAVKTAPISLPLNSDVVKANIIQIVKSLMLCDDVVQDAPLMSLGLDSLALTSLAALISTKFDLVVQPTFVFNFSNIIEMTDEIVQKKTGRNKYTTDWSSPHATPICFSIHIITKSTSLIRNRLESLE